jgi:hypothetical protein
MRIAAAEQCTQLDVEFAKALQLLDDEGEVDISDALMQDMGAILGSGMVQSIMASHSITLSNICH